MKGITARILELNSQRVTCASQRDPHPASPAPLPDAATEEEEEEVVRGRREGGAAPSGLAQGAAEAPRSGRGGGGEGRPRRGAEALRLPPLSSAAAVAVAVKGQEEVASGRPTCTRGGREAAERGPEPSGSYPQGPPPRVPETDDDESGEGGAGGSSSDDAEESNGGDVYFYYTVDERWIDYLERTEAGGLIRHARPKVRDEGQAV